jgi:phosphonate transport system substrate-binding protein
MLRFDIRLSPAVFFSCLLATLVLGFNARAADSFTFAVAPQFEQRKLFSTWKPIVDEVARRSGVKLDLVATLTVPQFEQAIGKGEYDFVYANPYHIVREVPHQGYIPLVRDAVPLRGILVVRKDDPIKSPAELDGKTLAVPSLNAIGPLLVRVDLAQRFHAAVAPIDAKTHSSVYLHVINGLAAAGGGVNKTLQEQDEAIRANLRVLYTTRDMPSHPIAAHPRVPKAVRDKVQDAFLSLAQTESGKALLAEVPMGQAVATSIKDYQPMTTWDLDRYWTEN